MTTTATRATDPSLVHMYGTLSGIDRTTRSVEVLASTPNPVEGEALTSWDLSRFMKNPVVLWSHNDVEAVDGLPIGIASEIRFVPAEGLKMRVRFAREAANPLAEQVWQGVCDGIVRAVSVGYDAPKEQVSTSEDGQVVKARSAAKLVEVSFVAIGADEDAGTVFINPEALDDEEVSKLVSQAASALAQHRARLAKTKAASLRTDAGDVLRLDRMRLGARLEKFDRTQVGGTHVPARLTRVGILTYRLPDGTSRRELRLPDEVFKVDSLKTLEHAPVIDIKDHTGMVTPETYRKVNLGHVTAVRQDGDYVVSELVIQDGDTLDAIESGERTEISCGYRCTLDMTPGTYKGEPYDAVQRNIRYNHAALCPPNRGRAGPDVGLRLDEKNPWAEAHVESEDAMTLKLIKLDGKDFEYGSDAHLEKVEAIHKREVEQVRADAKTEVEAAKAKADADAADAKKKQDELQARLDTASESIETLKLDAKKAKEETDAEMEKSKRSFKSRVLSRVKLMRTALRFFSDDDDDEDEDKMDALEDRDLMVKAIKKARPDFDEKDRSDEYVQAKFDSLVEELDARAKIGGVVRTVEEGMRRLDAGEDENDPVTKARRKRDEAAAKLWQTPSKTG